MEKGIGCNAESDILVVRILARLCGKLFCFGLAVPELVMIYHLMPGAGWLLSLVDEHSEDVA